LRKLLSDLILIFRQDPDTPDYEQIELVPVPEPNVITTIDEIMDDGDDQNSLINNEALKLPQQGKKRNQVSNLVLNTRKGG
jgi:hypothetical protein